MDRLITAIRFPIGLVSIVLSVTFWLVVFVLESVAALVSLLYMAIVSRRREIKESWLNRYPRTLRQIPPACSKVWKWIFADDVPEGSEGPAASSIVIATWAAIGITVVIGLLILFSKDSPVNLEGSSWYVSYTDGTADRFIFDSAGKVLIQPNVGPMSPPPTTQAPNGTWSLTGKDIKILMEGMTWTGQVNDSRRMSGTASGTRWVGNRNWSAARE